MPSKTDAQNAGAADFDALDNYFLEGDLDDDPFASPVPDDRPDSQTNKRKELGDGLGIDEEVSVAKKAKVPRIKLDQERLLSQKGIPALRKRARDLRLKGKGHEWRDASRLLSFYQEWLDDLFPKAKFLDALAMVEKAGHNKIMQKMRVDWINEGRPNATTSTTTIQDEEELQRQQQQDLDTLEAPRQTERVAPIFDKAAGGSDRLRTPEAEGFPGDDIYKATPVRAEKSGGATDKRGEPDEDELDALLAEAEGSGPSDPAKPKRSIFGDGKPRATERPRQAEPEGDDLDALLAEAEAPEPSGQKRAPAVDDDGDDLDALMAEGQGQGQEQPLREREHPGDGSGPGSKQAGPEFNDEEEAMAEMDGLW